MFLRLLILLSTAGVSSSFHQEASLRSSKGKATFDPLGLDEASLVQSGQVPLTETTHQSWFSRLGDAVGSVILGIILLPFSLVLMWLNEQRSARQECILQLGKNEVQTTSSKSVDFDKHGSLVHLNDAAAEGKERLEDRRFALSLSSALRLRSTVEVYQWEEQKHEEKKKDSVGGGESVVTTYNYNKKWCSYTIDSGNFKQPSHRNTLAVENLKVGTEDLNNPVVKYGDFSMPTDLVTQLCHWESANDLVKGPVKFGSCEFERSGAWFYFPKQRQPEVGDVRVAFEHVPNGEVTIMALQCEDKARIASFVPYRLVSRGFCGISTGKLQESLLAQGRKDPSQIYEEESCTSGPLKYLCCCCNLINLAFSQIPPQIFAAWHGHLDQRECFQSLETSGMLMKWGVRGLSWLLLYASCYMLFQPLLVVLDIIPFLGPYLSSGTSFVLCLVIFIITLLLAAVVVSLAYMVFHPLMGLMCFAGVALMFGAIAAMSNWLR